MKIVFLMIGIASLGFGVMTVAITCFPPPPLKTIEHDGHRWIKAKGSPPVHHPDCPCREVRGELLPEKP